MTHPIRARRLQKRLTQEDLANLAEVSVRTVQRVEAGSVTPSWDTLEALAEVLEASPEELTITHEMPEKVKEALRKIHEGMHDLSEYMYEHPEEIVKFGGASGTYVFQPRDLPPEIHHMISGETLPFHHAHLIEARPWRKEMGEGPHPDGEEEPWVRKICPGPDVTAVISVSPWRPLLWRATRDFTLTSSEKVRWTDPTRYEGTVEKIEVKEGDRIELVQGDWCGPFLYEFGTSLKLVRVEDQDIWAVFDHEALPVVPDLSQERRPWSVPRELQ